jgi:hypothetical protein
MNGFRIVFAVLAAAALSPVLLMALDFTCPDSLSTSQSATRTPPGWEAVPSSGTAHLDSVGFYLDNPGKGGALAPDKTEKKEREESVLWTFSRAPGDQFWAACIYTGTNLMLVRKIAPDVSKCEVRYALLPSGSRLRLTAISCK